MFASDDDRKWMNGLRKREKLRAISLFCVYIRRSYVSVVLFTHVKPVRYSRIYATMEIHLKVTAYLQGCLQSKGCSTFRLRRRYPNPHIKLKLIEVAIWMFHLRFKKFKKDFSWGWIWKVQFFFCEFQLNGNIAFREFVFSRYVTQKKETCQGFPLFDRILKLQSIFESASEKNGATAPKWFSSKKYLELSNSLTRYLLFSASHSSWNTIFPLSWNSQKVICTLQAQKIRKALQLFDWRIAWRYTALP